MVWLIPLSIVCFIGALVAFIGAASHTTPSGQETVEDVNHPSREFIIRQLVAVAWAAFICGVGAIVLYAAAGVFVEAMCIIVEPVTPAEDMAPPAPAEDAVKGVEGKL